MSTERASHGAQQKGTGSEPEPGEDLCYLFWGKTGWPPKRERAVLDNVDNMIPDVILRFGGTKADIFTIRGTKNLGSKIVVTNMTHCEEKDPLRCNHENVLRLSGVEVDKILLWL